MARKKSTESIDAEITKIKSDMSKLQDRYNKLADRLKNLEAIMDAYLRSSKSFAEIMTFLNP